MGQFFLQGRVKGLAKTLQRGRVRGDALIETIKIALTGMWIIERYLDVNINEMLRCEHFMRYRRMIVHANT